MGLGSDLAVQRLYDVRLADAGLAAQQDNLSLSSHGLLPSVQQKR